MVACASCAACALLSPACSDDDGSSQTDAGADAGADTDADGDADAGGDTDTDADTDTDTDADTDADGGDGLPDTTLESTLVAVAGEGDLSGDTSTRPSWGLVAEGPGEPWIERDDLGVGDAGTEPLGDPTSVGLIWHFGDSQIIDEESPARLINGDFYTDEAFRLHEAWSAQLLDAAIRTGNRFADARPFDFALAAGDMVDNIQGNELGWYMAVMEGGSVDPDSGDDDDPIPGEGNDPHDAFLAEGMHPDVPWYAVLGNHDALELGNGGVVASLLADHTGTATSWLSKAVVPTCLTAPYYDDESLTPDRCYVPPTDYYTDSEVVADEERATFTREQWIAAHFDTVTEPDGHGFTVDNVASGAGDYVVHDVVPGVPSALVVLDTSKWDSEVGALDATGADGTISEAQLAWLDAALTEAEAADEIIIVASHADTEEYTEETEAEALIATLQAHPNVVAHLVGHLHVNLIIPHPAVDGAPAENGYWEIVAPSTLEWPQQTRFIEIVDNRDGTGAIYCTNVNYEIPDDMQMLEGARFYSVFDMQSGGEISGMGAIEDRNAVLRFRWPPALEAMLAELDHRDVASFTWAE